MLYVTVLLNGKQYISVTSTQTPTSALVTIVLRFKDFRCNIDSNNYKKLFQIQLPLVYLRAEI